MDDEVRDMDARALRANRSGRTPDPTDRGRRLYERAALDHGVVASRALGRPRLRSARRRGELVPAHRGVHRFRAARATFEARALAACIAASRRCGAGFGSATGTRGALAALSHRSAAHVYGLDGGSAIQIELVCLRWDRTRHRGVRVHEMRELGPNDVRFVDGLAVVTAELALLQMAGLRTTSIAQVERMIYAARRKRLVSIESLDAMLLVKARRGRPGVRKLRTALAAARRHEMPPESDPEALLLQVCRARGLGEPRIQFELRDGAHVIGRFDGAFPELRLLFEYQSMAYHQNEDELARANDRHLAAFAAGWTVLEVRWWDLRTGGHRFARAVRAARNRAHPSPAQCAS